MNLELLLPIAPLVPLAVPTIGALTPTSTTALTVNWSNGDANATTQIYRDGALVGTALKGVTSLAQTGLSSGVTYAFRARHLLLGVYSPFTAIKYGYTVPAVPTGLGAQAIGNKVTLTWTNPNPSLQTEVRYNAGTLLATVAAGIATYDDTGLADGSYSYKVRATDGVTTSSYTSPVSSVVDTAVQPPTSLTKNVSGSTVELGWTNANGTDQIRVYRDAGLTPITTQPATTVAYNDTSRPNGTYAYTVRHYNGATESVDSNSVSATVDVAAYATPTGLSLSNAAYSDRVTVSWTDGEAQPVQIWRDGGSGYALAGTVAAGVQTYVDDGLTVTHAYDYKVRHYNSPDASLYTSPASVTTATPTLTSLSVSNSYTSQKFTVAYTAGAMPYGGTVYFSGATDDSGQNVGYSAASIHADTNGSFTYDFSPSGYTITKYPNGPSSGTLTVTNLKIKNGAAATLVTSAAFDCTFDYDSGDP